MAAENKRGRQTVRGMVLSLAVVLLSAWVIYLFVPHDDTMDPVKPVSYRVELDSARRAAPYPVAAPHGLPKEWRATSVTYDADSEMGAAWHLGFMRPHDQYAAVEQSDPAEPGKYVSQVTQGAHRTSKTVRIKGAEWTRYEGSKYDALVRESGSGKERHTTVVTGTASFERLAQLAGALEAKRAPVPGSAHGSQGPQQQTGQPGQPQG